MMADPEVAAAMDRINANFMKFFVAGDMKSLSELYTEDCSLMPPGNDVVKGRKAVEEFLVKFKASGVGKIDLRTDETLGGRPYGVEVGSYTMTMADGTSGGSGKSLIVLKKVDGVFYVHCDIFNSD